MEFNKWISQTHGKLELDEVFGHILDFVKEKPHRDYDIVIGSDSQPNFKFQDTTYVTVITVHRKGEYGRYFSYKTREKGLQMVGRIFREATNSLEIANKFSKFMDENSTNLKKTNIKFEVHLDMGRKGATRDLIKQVVGMITGSGFDAKIKPESWCASSIADRHTKS